MTASLDGSKLIISSHDFCIDDLSAQKARALARALSA